MWVVPQLPVAAFALFVTGFSLGPNIPYNHCAYVRYTPQSYCAERNRFSCWLWQHGSRASSLDCRQSGTALWDVDLAPIRHFADRHLARSLGHYADETRLFRRNTCLAYQNEAICCVSSSSGSIFVVQPLTRLLQYTEGRVIIQQGVPRGQHGPSAGCGVSPPIFPLAPPEAAQGKGPE